MNKCCHWVIIILIVLAIALAACFWYIGKKINNIDEKINNIDEKITPGVSVRESAPKLQDLALKLKGLSEKQLVDVKAGSCAASDHDISGERASGGTGGFALVGERASGGTSGIIAIAAESVISPANVISKLDPHSLAGLTNLNESVAILIVDIFGVEFSDGKKIKDSKYTLDNELFTLDPTPLLEDPNTTRAQELKDKLGSASHGALVLNHTIALIQATGKYEMDASELVTKGRVKFTEIIGQPQQQAGPVGPQQDTDTALVGPQQDAYAVEQYTETPAEPKEILVWSLDIGHLSTTEELDYFTPSIKTIFDELAAYEQKGINEIVLNMSFSLLPCNTLDDFLANKDSFPTLEEYAVAVAEKNRHLRRDFSNLSDEQWVIAITELLLAAPSQDVFYLFNFIGNKAREENEGTNIIYAAAAGNYSLPYSMYPAAWEEVISVSANRIKDNSQVGFSNEGKISAHGDWYFLPDPVGSGNDNQNIAYAGTSFAAPVVAVFTALDLARGGDNNDYKCARDHVSPNNDFYRLPKLLQANGGAINDTNSGNVPLATAVGEVCN